jgi:hypothetical protein
MAQELDFETQIVAFARSQLQLNPLKDLDLPSQVALCWRSRAERMPYLRGHLRKKSRPWAMSEHLYLSPFVFSQHLLPKFRNYNQLIFLLLSSTNEYVRRER